MDPNQEETTTTTATHSPEAMGPSVEEQQPPLETEEPTTHNTLEHEGPSTDAPPPTSTPMATATTTVEPMNATDHPDDDDNDGPSPMSDKTPVHENDDDNHNDDDNNDKTTQDVPQIEPDDTTPPLSEEASQTNAVSSAQPLVEEVHNETHSSSLVVPATTTDQQNTEEHDDHPPSTESPTDSAETVSVPLVMSETVDQSPLPTADAPPETDDDDDDELIVGAPAAASSSTPLLDAAADDDALPASATMDLTDANAAPPLEEPPVAPTSTGGVAESTVPSTEPSPQPVEDDAASTTLVESTLQETVPSTEPVPQTVQDTAIPAAASTTLVSLTPQTEQNDALPALTTTMGKSTEANAPHTEPSSQTDQDDATPALTTTIGESIEATVLQTKELRQPVEDDGLPASTTTGESTEANLPPTEPLSQTVVNDTMPDSTTTTGESTESKPPTTQDDRIPASTTVESTPVQPQIEKSPSATEEEEEDNDTMPALSTTTTTALESTEANPQIEQSPQLLEENNVIPASTATLESTETNPQQTAEDDPKPALTTRLESTEAIPHSEQSPQTTEDDTITALSTTGESTDTNMQQTEEPPSTTTAALESTEANALSEQSPLAQENDTMPALSTTGEMTEANPQHTEEPPSTTTAALESTDANALSEQSPLAQEDDAIPALSSTEELTEANPQHTEEPPPTEEEEDAEPALSTAAALESTEANAPREQSPLAQEDDAIPASMTTLESTDLDLHDEKSVPTTQEETTPASSTIEMNDSDAHHDKSVEPDEREASVETGALTQTPKEDDTTTPPSSTTVESSDWNGPVAESPPTEPLEARVETEPVTVTDETRPPSTPMESADSSNEQTRHSPPQNDETATPLSTTMAPTNSDGQSGAPTSLQEENSPSSTTMESPDLDAPIQASLLTKGESTPPESLGVTEQESQRAEDDATPATMTLESTNVKAQNEELQRTEDDAPPPSTTIEFSDTTTESKELHRIGDDDATPLPSTTMESSHLDTENAQPPPIVDDITPLMTAIESTDLDVQKEGSKRIEDHSTPPPPAIKSSNLDTQQDESQPTENETTLPLTAIESTDLDVQQEESKRMEDHSTPPPAEIKSSNLDTQQDESQPTENETTLPLTAIESTDLDVQQEESKRIEDHSTPPPGATESSNLDTQQDESQPTENETTLPLTAIESTDLDVQQEESKRMEDHSTPPPAEIKSSNLDTQQDESQPTENETTLPLTAIESTDLDVQQEESKRMEDHSTPPPGATESSNLDTQQDESQPTEDETTPPSTAIEPPGLDVQKEKSPIDENDAPPIATALNELGSSSHPTSMDEAQSKSTKVETFDDVYGLPKDSAIGAPLVEPPESMIADPTVDTDGSPSQKSSSDSVEQLPITDETSAAIQPSPEPLTDGQSNMNGSTNGQHDEVKSQLLSDDGDTKHIHEAVMATSSVHTLAVCVVDTALEDGGAETIQTQNVADENQVDDSDLPVHDTGQPLSSQQRDLVGTNESSLNVNTQKEPALLMELSNNACSNGNPALNVSEDDETAASAQTELEEKTQQTPPQWEETRTVNDECLPGKNSIGAARDDEDRPPGQSEKNEISRTTEVKHSIEHSQKVDATISCNGDSDQQAKPPLAPFSEPIEKVGLNETEEKETVDNHEKEQHLGEIEGEKPVDALDTVVEPTEESGPGHHLMVPLPEVDEQSTLQQQTLPETSLQLNGNQETDIGGRQDMDADVTNQELGLNERSSKLPNNETGFTEKTTEATEEVSPHSSSSTLIPISPLPSSNSSAHPSEAPLEQSEGQKRSKSISVTPITSPKEFVRNELESSKKVDGLTTMSPQSTIGISPLPSFGLSPPPTLSTDIDQEDEELDDDEVYEGYFQYLTERILVASQPPLPPPSPTLPMQLPLVQTTTPVASNVRSKETRAKRKGGIRFSSRPDSSENDDEEDDDDDEFDYDDDENDIDGSDSVGSSSSRNPVSLNVEDTTIPTNNLKGLSSFIPSGRTANSVLVNLPTTPYWTRVSRFFDDRQFLWLALDPFVEEGSNGNVIDDDDGEVEDMSHLHSHTVQSIYAALHGQVVELPWESAGCGGLVSTTPSLGTLLRICYTVHGWLERTGEKSVIVLACRNGQTKTALAAAACLRFLGKVPSVQAGFSQFVACTRQNSLHHEDEVARDKVAPQALWDALPPSIINVLQHVDDVLERKRRGREIFPQPLPLRLKAISLQGVPVDEKPCIEIWNTSGNLLFASHPHLYSDTHFNLPRSTSEWADDEGLYLIRDDINDDDHLSNRQSKRMDDSHHREDNQVERDVLLQGDFCLLGRFGGANHEYDVHDSSKWLFRYVQSTAFLSSSSGSIELNCEDVDLMRRYEQMFFERGDFGLTLVVEPYWNSGVVSPSARSKPIHRRRPSSPPCTPSALPQLYDGPDSLEEGWRCIAQYHICQPTTTDVEICRQKYRSELLQLQRPCPPHIVRLALQMAYGRHKPRQQETEHFAQSLLTRGCLRNFWKPHKQYHKATTRRPSIVTSSRPNNHQPSWLWPSTPQTEKPEDAAGHEEAVNEHLPAKNLSASFEPGDADGVAERTKSSMTKSKESDQQSGSENSVARTQTSNEAPPKTATERKGGEVQDGALSGSFLDEIGHNAPTTSDSSTPGSGLLASIAAKRTSEDVKEVSNDKTSEVARQAPVHVVNETGDHGRTGVLAAITARGTAEEGTNDGDGGRAGLMAAIAAKGSLKQTDGEQSSLEGATTAKPNTAKRENDNSSGGRAGLLAAIAAKNGDVKEGGGSEGVGRADLMAAISGITPSEQNDESGRSGLMAAISAKGKQIKDDNGTSDGGRAGLMAAIASKGSTVEKNDDGKQRSDDGRAGLLAAISKKDDVVTSKTEGKESQTERPSPQDSDARKGDMGGNASELLNQLNELGITLNDLTRLEQVSQLIEEKKGSKSKSSDDANSPSPPMKNDSRFGKYWKMKNVGIPEGAIRNALKKDGWDETIWDNLDWNKNYDQQQKPSTQSPEEEKKEDPNDSGGCDKPTMKNDSRFGKYYKMKSVGLPEGAIRNAMTRDGVDPSVLDLDWEKNYEDQISKPAGDSKDGPSMKDDERFSKYWKMKSVGLPDGAIMNAMTRDGVDPKALELDWDKNYETQTQATSGGGSEKTGPPMKEDERFAKYWKMKSVGLPDGAIMNAMTRDGVDPKALDMDWDKNYEDQTKPAGGDNASPPSGPPMKEDERFAKYWKMKSVGLPDGAIMNAMARDGVDAKALDLDWDKNYEDQTKPAGNDGTSAPSGPPMKEDERFAKYWKMKSVGLPDGAIMNAMSRDGVDPKALDLDWDKNYEAQTQPSGTSTVDTVDSGPPLKDDPEYSKYFKMLSVGLPPPAVQNAMSRDGKDPKILDLDPNKSVASQLKTDTAKRAPAKKKKKVRRKKIYWTPIDPGQIKEDSLWSIVKGKLSMTQLNYDVKEFEDLFTESTDPADKKQKKPKKSGGEKKEKKSVQVIDGKRSMNGGIILLRLRMAYNTIASMIDKMYEPGMFFEDLVYQICLTR